MDQLTNYYTELGLAQDEARYQAELDYGRYMDKLGLDYQMERDKIGDEQWQKTFDEGVRQYNEQMELQKKTSGGSGGGTKTVYVQKPVTTERKTAGKYSNMGVVEYSDTATGVRDYVGVLTGLRTLKADGTSWADASAYLGEACDNGYITEEEKQSLSIRYNNGSLY